MLREERTQHSQFRLWHGSSWTDFCLGMIYFLLHQQHPIRTNPGTSPIKLRLHQSNSAHGQPSSCMRLNHNNGKGDSPSIFRASFYTTSIKSTKALFWAADLKTQKSQNPPVFIPSMTQPQHPTTSHPLIPHLTHMPPSKAIAKSHKLQYKAKTTYRVHFLSRLHPGIRVCACNGQHGREFTGEFLIFIRGCLKFKIYISLIEQIEGMSRRNQPKYTHNCKKSEQKSANFEANPQQAHKNDQHNKIERNCDQGSPQHIYTLLENNEKVIPGYNFESLFRKKSHLRFARKKTKEQALKKHSNTKHELDERQTKNVQKGHWTNEESKLYHWFLELHNRHFVVKQLRRADKIFKSMANFIRTREAQQCRSHHQKMQKKYHSFYQILSKLRTDFYGGIGNDLLKIDLEQNGYTVKENSLITQGQLKNGESIPRQCKFEEMEDSLANGQGQVGHEKEDHSNMLGENYQNGLHFGNMHY